MPSSSSGHNGLISPSTSESFEDEEDVSPLLVGSPLSDGGGFDVVPAPRSHPASFGQSHTCQGFQRNVLKSLKII